MSTADKVGNRKDYVKLAQLYAAIRRFEREKFVECIINDQGDINLKVPATDFLKLHRPELIDSSALHYAFEQDNLAIFNLLLDSHADCSAQNYKKQTVVRRAVEENFYKRELMKLRRRFNDYNNNFTVDEVNGFVVMQRAIEMNDFMKYDNNWRLWGTFEDKYVRSILASCVKNGIFESPANCELSHFHAACLTNNVEAVDFFLRNGADVNQWSSAFFQLSPLHIAVKYAKLDVINSLLANEANVFARNAESMSPVDVLLDQNLRIIEWLQRPKSKLPYKDSIFHYLENEEKLKSIMTKYSHENSRGLSRLHVACALTNGNTTQFLSDNPLGAVNDRVGLDSPWAGYTALHFAARFSTDALKILLQRGADIEAKDANGVTPLDILATRAPVEDLLFVVARQESWRDITFSDGKTKLLDLLSAMSAAGSSFFYSFVHSIDVDTFIPLDSPLWPGCTILHLVVTLSETTKKLTFLKNVYNTDRSNLHVEYERLSREQETRYLGRIETCMDLEADLTIADARGWTPVQLAFRLGRTEAFALMLQSQSKPGNPSDDDNLSHLHVACLARDHVLVEKLISNGADVNSAISSTFEWSQLDNSCTDDAFNIVGATPLHLAVANEDLEMVRILRQNGADVNAKDARGMSPLHRIFVLQRVWEIGNDLFKVPKVVRYVHRRGRRMGIANYRRALEVLGKVAEELLSASSLRDSIVDQLGLSHLHVAVFNGNADAVERLLNLGSDVNSPITYGGKMLDPRHPLFVLSRYDGYTPLRMVRDSCNTQLENMLLERGADVLARGADGTCPLFDALQCRHSQNVDALVKLLKDKEELADRLRREFGWTILHVACQLIDWELVQYALGIGLDVNARTKDDSPLCPGGTALHVLMANCDRIRESEYAASNHARIMQSLLDNGAKITMTDVHGNAPLHRSDFILGDTRKSYARSLHAMKLLQFVDDFTNNPINRDGISVFHVACIRHDVAIVRKFLDRGVDVNQSVELFSDGYLAGCTPLHLAARYPSGDNSEDYQLQTVELLLSRGADPRAEDVLGDTPLHAAVQCCPPRIAVFQTILEYGADVDAKNVHGKTPLEILLSSPRLGARQLEFFLQRGCRMNTFNPITQVGYIPLLYRSNQKSMESDTLLAALSCPSIKELDRMGRTAIHNVVSISSFPNSDDSDVIGYLVDAGCDIDRRDDSGRTALHLAVQFRNEDAVEGLLMHEADVDVVDSAGNRVFAYCLDTLSMCNLTDGGGGSHDHSRVFHLLARYMYHLLYRGYRGNESHAVMQTLFDGSNHENLAASRNEKDYANLRGVKIGDTAFTLDDFLSETGAIVKYSKIEQKDREVVDRFFTSTIVEELHFRDWRFLCQLQYRKARQRAQLVDDAKDAMDILVGYPLPDLCFEAIERLLSNGDLKRLIATMNL